MINIAVTGKGGVGKTTLAGTLSRFLSRDGYNVLAIDADPDMNLGSVLGVDTSKVTPLSENQELIAERTGSRPGASPGGVFKLNPKVDDIAESYGLEAPDGVELVVMGTIKKGGSGCMCPADAFLRALLKHVVVSRGDAVVLDMEAGVEHLGRGTAESVDTMIVVVEPGLKSVETAERIKRLADDVGIQNLRAVINKVSSEEGVQRVEEHLEEINIPLMGVIPYDKTFVKSDLSGEAPLDVDLNSEGIRKIKEIEEMLADGV